MMIESIKQGFSITHKNWQVILLRVAAGAINVIGFFFLVGTPVIIAIISFGIDVAQVRDMFPGILENPMDILTRYIGLAVLVAVAFLIYLTVASIIIIYAYGGTIGVLRNAVLDEQFKFSYSGFFREAGRFFFPLVWLSSLAMLLILAAVIAFAILAGVVFAVTQVSAGSGSSLIVFFSTFFSLLLVFLALTLGLGSLIYIVYASIAMVADGRGVMDSFRSAWVFVMGRPMAFVFYILLIIGILAVNILLVMIGFAFQMTPIIGPFAGIPYKVAYCAVQVYLGVVMWGALVAYYMRGTKRSASEVIQTPARDI
ncbi:MAG TPA: hypothetical protein ENH45_06590 [Nitrospirae bacterium]|nr:hypothetical protein BMS3Abin10_02215 [bacterium BMS3Abin10]GBE40048.1 hypothetical protein BMS3Bbin08_02685 [bacterium BMS3Bbin08]HDH50274.1 hypothetical protein [Nitrospirota bacterium]HDK17387.1 hypothetical protein [Nitrospirota bacterium]HDZ84873.1 hypothetical protein [Nitrospirota bacterium]